MPSDAARGPRTLGALRSGVLSGAWSVAGSYGRLLLPRSASDQAIATGVVSAFHLGAGTLAYAVAETLAQDLVDRVGRGSKDATLLAACGIVAAGSAAVVRSIPEDREHPMLLQVSRAAALKLAGGSLAGAAVTSYDLIEERFDLPRNRFLSVAAAAAIGGAVAAVSVWRRDRRAAKFGVQDAARHQITPTKGLKGAAMSAGMGLAGGGALLALAGGEYVVAEGTTIVLSRLAGRSDDPVTPVVGHVVALATLTSAGFWGLDRLRRRLEHQDDIVEPAYPEPPSSPHVTAGPNSEVGFDQIGKEGRRFVTMVSTPEQIVEVMGGPAVAPVRAIAGYETTRDVTERARLAVTELERLGGFERAAIVVAAPTGVGYVNYVVIEALEYLTRGDVATVVPQYALVPSALALDATRDAVKLQTLVLEGIRDRIASMPEHQRPRLLQFGESLGAQVALDVIGAQQSTARLAELGVERGLYLGVPFRSRVWQRWADDPAEVDPPRLLTLVADPYDSDPAVASVRHLMVVHHDDPVNMFSYDAAVRPPWWLGPPDTRPVMVPKETLFRPFTTFVLMLVDLKNGMNSKPGTFVRQGHDYRIDARAALELAFGLTTTPEQADRIEAAIRRSETEWAARRMVARRFARARSAVLDQLKSWGVNPADIDLDEAAAGELAQGHLSAFAARMGTSS